MTNDNFKNIQHVSLQLTRRTAAGDATVDDNWLSGTTERPT